MANLGQTLKVLNRAVKAGMQVASEPARQGRFMVADRVIVCPHCGGQQFAENPSGVGLLVRGFSNASILLCQACSRVEIFLQPVSRIREKTNPESDRHPSNIESQPEQ